MAALSLSSPSATLAILQPPSLDFSVMPTMPIMTMPTASSRRAPLSSNPNAANSPLRGAASKVKRSYATLQREEQYGQPPPLKKQMLENGSHRASRSPTHVRTRPAQQTTRPKPKAPSTATESTQYQKPQEKDRDLVSWQKQYRARFPRMVFYFDSVPDDVRARLVKLIVHLGAVSRLALPPYDEQTP